ncbi:DUF551 domain-containing protein [Escherichia coli]|uniref:DUF551 domain-containing protein n=1 Tax=Escherichia coli TaxID=562 RepID=UPI00203DAE6F|nr:DUF551 domain-containing protein [Escherichia coli]
MTIPSTKEQLIAKAQEQIEFCRHTTITGEGRNHVDQCLALFEIALAAMDAEPAGWQVKKHGGNWVSIKEEEVHHYKFNEELPVREIYATPPVAIVNAEPVADVVAWHKEGEERTCDIRWRRFDVAPGPLFAVAQPAMKVPDALPENDDEDGNDIDYMEPTEVYALGKRAGWNACRTAMLQAGNSPVIQDGWVKCSERMPKDAQWCAVNTKYGYYVQCWSDGQGWLGDEISIPDCDVTHWMPLPAAPQQEGK